MGFNFVKVEASYLLKISFAGYSFSQNTYAYLSWNQF
jgi:hypothetical protein